MIKLRFLILFLFVISAASLLARTVKISAVPADAHISVDGAYQGDGSVELEVKKKAVYYVIRVEREGYLTLESRLYSSYKNDEITYTQKKDLFYEASVASDVSNTFFPVIVSHRLYSEDADGKRDVSKVWRTVNQILLGYFDRIESSEEASGFVQTAWSYTKFNDSQQVVRTRVYVKQVGVLEKDLTLQVKISSETAPLVSMDNENTYRETPRILKKFEPLIHEFESKLLGQ